MRLVYGIFVSFLLVLIITECGTHDGVKKGDRFKVLQTLKEAADIQGNLEYSDGFTCTVPKGTILEVIYSERSSGFFECRPVKVNGKSGKEYIIQNLVPEMVRNREGFEDFSITLSVEYIGSKLKKL